MKKLFWVSVVIAVFAAFFASTHPDGLDFVAEKFGFAEKGIERPAPMSDYGIRYLPKGKGSTAIAGIAGIVIILSAFWISARIKLPL